MKYRASNVIVIIALLTILISLLSNLDSDRETLLQAGIVKRPPSIVVNQLGYLPWEPKIAFFRQTTSGDVPQIDPQLVQLIDADRQETIETLSLHSKGVDSDTEDRIAEIDFSQITQPGTYYLRTKKYRSVPFTIGTEIYQKPSLELLRSYYLQRCGVEIDDPVTGIRHAPCHLQDGVLAQTTRHGFAGEKIDGTGGWHDAGAYGKYVATTTVAVGRLLSLYEQYPQLFPDNQLEIPESGNGRSDLLDEMEFGLNWLLKMQREDGAVYRKIAGQEWPLDLASDEDIQPRYIYGISTPETAKFAAVMALASRVFSEPDLAARYLTASRLAWQYLQTQPEMKVDWFEEDDSGSDKYLADASNPEPSLTTDIDDRLWAAAELYITTGEPDLVQYLRANLGSVEYTLFEWKNPAPLGMWNYWRQDRRGVEPKIVRQIEAKILHRADLLLSKIEESGYDLANDRFIWGSNKIIAEEGMTLVYAYRLSQNSRYLDGARAQLDYLLGRNHFNQTFITNVGTNPVKNLSNLYARAKGVKLPGLVVAGANSDSPDGRVWRNRGPLSYVDDELAYAINGNASDYNASVIALIVNLWELGKSVQNVQS